MNHSISRCSKLVSLCTTSCWFIDDDDDDDDNDGDGYVIRLSAAL